MKFPRAKLRLSLDPYPMTLHLYTSRATYCRAVNEGRARPLVGAKDQEHDGLCIVRGADIAVGVFTGDLSTLVHELTHAMEHVADYVGLERGFPNEPGAYLMQRMYRECVGALKP